MNASDNGTIIGFDSTVKLNGLNIGDTFIDTVVPADRGMKTKRRINGRPCFVQDYDMEPLVGGRWLLKLEAENPRGTVYFASMEKLVGMTGSMQEVLEQSGVTTSWDVREVMEAHPIILASQEACAPESLGLAGALMEVASRRLPKGYRRYLARQVQAIYVKNQLESDQRMLAVLKVLAYTAPEDEKFGAWEQVVIMQDRIGDTQEARAQALAHLGMILHEREDYSQALPFLERSHDLVDNCYIGASLAECRAKAGDFERAYGLIAHFPEMHFDCVEGEWSTSRDQFLHESFPGEGQDD